MTIETIISGRRETGQQGTFPMKHDSNASPNAHSGIGDSSLRLLLAKKEAIFWNRSPGSIFGLFPSGKCVDPGNPRAVIPQRDFARKSGFFWKKRINLTERLREFLVDYSGVSPSLSSFSLPMAMDLLVINFFGLSLSLDTMGFGHCYSTGNGVEIMMAEDKLSSHWR